MDAQMWKGEEDESEMGSEWGEDEDSEEDSEGEDEEVRPFFVVVEATFGVVAC